MQVGSSDIELIALSMSGASFPRLSSGMRINRAVLPTPLGDSSSSLAALRKMGETGSWNMETRRERFLRFGKLCLSVEGPASGSTFEKIMDMTLVERAVQRAACLLSGVSSTGTSDRKETP